MRKSKKTAMYKLVEDWQLSGQSKSLFSKSHGIKTSIFYYWLNKYEKEKELASQVTHQGKFIPLTLDSPLTSQMSIVYPNGVKLELSGQLPTDQLIALIKLGSHV